MSKNRSIFIQNQLKNAGSSALLDKRLDSGVIMLNFDKSHHKCLTNWHEAKKAFIHADDTTNSWFTSDLIDKVPYCPVNVTTLEVIVVSYNNRKTVRESSEKILEDLSLAGYRPARFEELVAAAIVRPSLFKLPMRLIALGSKYDIPAGVGWLENIKASYIPYLSWMADQRTLGTSFWASPWNDSDRFLCTTDIET